MRRLSVKLRVTLWYAALLVLMCAVLFAGIRIVTRRAEEEYVRATLESAAKVIIDDLRLDAERLELSDSLKDVPNVYAALFDAGGSLIYGRVYTRAAFSDGVLQRVSERGHSGYVLDRLLDAGGEDVWLRLYSSADASWGAQLSALRYGFWVFPALIAVALAGGWLLTARAFRPVKAMTALAASIADGSDLSRRVGRDLASSRAGRRAEKGKTAQNRGAPAKSVRNEADQRPHEEDAPAGEAPRATDALSAKPPRKRDACGDRAADPPEGAPGENAQNRGAPAKSARNEADQCPREEDAPSAKPPRGEDAPSAKSPRRKDVLSTGRRKRRLRGTPRSGDELRALAATFDAMLDRLERAFHREQRFTSDVAHELRTPLNAIATQCEFALSRASIAEKDEALERILEKNDEMSALVRQLLLIARAESGQMPMDDDCPLDQMLAGIVDDLLPVAEERGVRISLQAEPFARRGNRALLARVFVNLLDNAIRYGRSAVEVRLRRDGDGAVVTVEDDGRGLPDGAEDMVFERFWRADQARSTPGNGIGLSIVRSAVEAHGGSVRAENRPEGGARFTVRL